MKKPNTKRGARPAPAAPADIKDEALSLADELSNIKREGAAVLLSAHGVAATGMPLAGLLHISNEHLEHLEKFQEKFDAWRAKL